MGLFPFQLPVRETLIIPRCQYDSTVFGQNVQSLWPIWEGRDGENSLNFPGTLNAPCLAMMFNDWNNDTNMMGLIPPSRLVVITRPPIPSSNSHPREQLGSMVAVVLFLGLSVHRPVILPRESVDLILATCASTIVVGMGNKKAL